MSNYILIIIVVSCRAPVSLCSEWSPFVYSTPCYLPLLDVVATLFDVMNMEGLYLYMSWAPTMLYRMAIQLIRVGENLKFKIFDELEKNKLLKLTIQAIRMFE